MIIEEFYTGEEYLQKNPTWHVEEAPWKVAGILKMMARNKLRPQSICEIGCGAGEVLKLVQEHMDENCELWGYEIAPKAYELSKSRENAKLHFKLGDVREEPGAFFDLILIIDVLEHFEDCFRFLRDIKATSQYKIFLLPLDISVMSVLRRNLIRYREATGHLHYFTKEIGLQVLKDNGYEVLDYFYTTSPEDGFPWNEVIRNPLKLPRKLLGLVKRSLIRLPRTLLFAANQDLAVRIFGEWRLVVLAK